MTTFKPYVKRELIHSPRGEEVLKALTGYLIQTFHNDGESVLTREARVPNPSPCIAALRVAKEHNIRCLVYAVGNIYGSEALELVDEEFLLKRMYGHGPVPDPTPAITGAFPNLRRG